MRLLGEASELQAHSLQQCGDVGVVNLGKAVPAVPRFPGYIAVELLPGLSACHQEPCVARDK